MKLEKHRQDLNREMEEKDAEMAELKTNLQKKVRSVEVQLEEEQGDKQRVIREKRDLERQLVEQLGQGPKRDRGIFSLY